MVSKKSNLISVVKTALKDITDSSSSADMRAALSKTRVLNVTEVDVPSTNKKALVIKVSYTSFMNYINPIHARCISELEKKTKKHVCFLAKRDVYKQSEKRVGQRVRPYSRTLTAVHDAILNDIIGPIEISGKRLVVQTDGTRLYKILIHPKEKSKDDVEEKLPTFAAVYNALTHKNTVFEFSDYVL